MFLPTLRSSYKYSSTANVTASTTTSSIHFLCNPKKGGQPLNSSTCYSNANTPVTTSSTCRQYSQTSTSFQARKTQRTALILGSSGSLGSSIASQLKSNHDCIVIGSDIHPPSKERVDCIDAFIQLPSSGSGSSSSSSSSSITIDTLYHGLRDGLRNLYNDNDEDVQLDAIICANGGFAMDDDDDEIDNHGDDDKHDNNHDNNHDDKKQPNKGHVYESMLQMNYYPVIAAGEIAKSYMNTNTNTNTNNSTLFVALGAAAALTPAPNMTAYTSSKVLTHYYIQTIGSMTGHALKKEYKVQRSNEMGKKMRRDGRYLDNMSALGILPVMLDTESNREALPEEDFSRWTKTEDVAKEIGVWMDTPELRPHSGSLVRVRTTNGESEFKLAR